MFFQSFIEWGCEEKLLSIYLNLYYGEFDPGSGRTLAAWIRHASRTVGLYRKIEFESGERVSNT